MAVLVGGRFVRDTGVRDVALGRRLRSGPRVLPRRPGGRPRPVSALARAESTSCHVRLAGDSALELVAVGVLSALTVIALGMLYLQQVGVAP